MPTLDQIKEQIKQFDKTGFTLSRKEVKELPNILRENETVENATSGTYNNSGGLLVGTNSRVLFIDKGLLYGLKIEEFGLDKISSSQFETGLLMGKLTIFASGNKAVIDMVPKGEVKAFAEWLSNKITNKSSTPTPSTNDVTDQIKKLAELRDGGILTEEEFTAKKKQLLGI
jgi:hypothetical protein